MLTLSAAGVISTTIEAILYGYSVFMFMLAMWIMLRDRKKRRVNWWMVAAGVALLFFSTAEMGCNIGRLYIGLLTVGPTFPGGSNAFFAEVSETTFVVKSCLYNVQTLILDAVVIYRTYIVWHRIWVIIVPCLGWGGLFVVPSSATSIGLNWALATAGQHKNDVFAAETGRWITALYALTLATNLSSTLLLAARIWTIARRSAQYRTNSIFTPVLRVIIESGAIYSVTITAALITFVVQSPGVYVILDMISPIISIVFYMLTIRTGLAGGRALSSNKDPSTHPSTTWPSSGRGAHRTDGSYIMQDLKVEITQVTDDNSDYDPHSHHRALESVLDPKLDTRPAPTPAPRRADEESGDRGEGSSRDSGSFVAVAAALPSFDVAVGQKVDRGYGLWPATGRAA
ncbi:uncharacterized protein BXZ73DRAFT_46154 [Epithele typhae]|uniref:uncharacterized protein n=1 Tax=Epithele typhae TaxID=378194 RepID=UPI00200861E9|nr:uncharacterized protein BXZ73DRAFT_46154 [Epithele typhae]KAH9934014.1 hypothetical protein BXZ73DRAFT_46154 [Epithele typhae]